MSLRELYQEIILDHGKSPRHFGTLTEATHVQAGHNPLCGDKLLITLNEENGKITKACFEGVGCAISVASASLMLEVVQGKSREEIEKLFQEFTHLVKEGKGDQEYLGKLIAFSGVAEFPLRVKCATLAWHTLRAALLREPKTVTTE